MAQAPFWFLSLCGDHADVTVTFFSSIVLQTHGCTQSFHKVHSAISMVSGSHPGCWHLPPGSEAGLCPTGLVSGDSVLGVQVAERQLQAWEAAQQAEAEEEEVQRAERLSDALLQQEAKAMAEEGYRPKVGTCQVTGRRSPILGSLVPPCVCLCGC